MVNRTTIKQLAIAIFAISFLLALPRPLFAQDTNDVNLRSIEVAGKVVPWKPNEELRLGPFPENVVFNFGPVHDDRNVPQRLRARMEGYESAWHEGGGEMYLRIRFYNSTGDRIAESTFMIRGESAGWSGALATSTPAHRHEALTVPPGASHLWVVLSSAGPPSTIGMYVVQDLTVSKLSSGDGKPSVILTFPFDHDAISVDDIPAGWERDGTRPSMAKTISVGASSKANAFAIVDDAPLDHAEWHNTRDSAAPVTPGDHLSLEWNEMFSMGDGAYRSETYARLPAGSYKFIVSKVTMLGEPLGKEAILAIHVRQPYWKMPWFWPTLTAFIVVILVSTFRYYAWRKVQHTLAQLQQQHVLGQERLRISQDIHDDLGARVTQISMVSGIAQKDPTFSDKARAEFDRISVMSRDLVSALYETVWAVNPENDNLEAMANYICQQANDLCAQAGLRCRVNIAPFHQNMEISSRARHNISLATKEIVHNIIKHAKATLVTVHMTFSDKLLTVSIYDDGCGFQPDNVRSGYGLINIQRRMEYIGGSCQIESAPGKGTIVHLRLNMNTSPEDFVRS